MKIFIFSILLVVIFAAPAFSQNTDTDFSETAEAAIVGSDNTIQDRSSFDAFANKSATTPKVSIFSFSSDDLDASEGLDRISGGSYDRGYSRPEQSYKSAGAAAGPFAREKQAMADSDSGR